MRFAYRLAAQLGHVDVYAMLRTITARQFTEWIAYYMLEPFGTFNEPIIKPRKTPEQMRATFEQFFGLS